MGSAPLRSRFGSWVEISLLTPYLCVGSSQVGRGDVGRQPRLNRGGEGADVPSRHPVRRVRVGEDLHAAGLELLTKS